MKARTDRKTLVTAIRDVSMALKVRPVKEYEECIFVCVDDSGLTLIATNGEQRIRETIECDALEHGTALVNGRMFGALVNKMDVDEIVHMESDGKQLKLRVATQTARMTEIPDDGFPGETGIDNPNVISVTGGDLATALNGVRYATAKEMTRLLLTGVLMEFTNGKMFTVALDGYRMAAYRKNCEHKSNGRYVTPGVVATMAAMFAEDTELVEIRAGGGRIKFDFGNIQLDSILYSGNFPDWKNIVPQEFRAAGKVSKDELLGAAELASVATSKSYAIRTDFSESGIHMTANGDTSGTEQDIEAEMWLSSDGPFKAAYNAAYIIDALKAVSASEVQFKAADETKPAVITPVEGNEFLMLVLPVRVHY